MTDGDRTGINGSFLWIFGRHDKKRWSKTGDIVCVVYRELFKKNFFFEP